MGTLTSLQRVALVGILLGFAALAFGYSVTVPAFETPDEVHHYAFARHLSQGNELPIQTLESQGPWEHEGTQAPLYYMALAQLIRLIDQSDFDEFDRVNPHANLGDPLYPGNKNRMLYSAVDHPLVGTNLALQVGRWFSIGLSLLTLILLYATVRLIRPEEPGVALLTLLLTASIPQVQFIGATVSNDNMVILVSTATLFWLVRLAVRPGSAPIRLWEWGVLGALLGMAGLSKLQGLGLLPLSALAVTALAWQRRDWRMWLTAGVIMAALFALIAGWWYWRNYTLYGEWLGVQQLLTINGLRGESVSLAHFWGELRGVRYSFWGLFGWFSILYPPLFYTVLDVILPVAVIGLLAGYARRWRRRGWAGLWTPQGRGHAILLLWGVMLLGLMVYWLSFATSGQGRLLFPGLTAYGLFLVLGLCYWLKFLPKIWRLPSFLLLPGFLVASSLYALIVLLPASYDAPRPVQALPGSATPYGFVFADRMELVGAEIGTEIGTEIGAEGGAGRYAPGDEVEVVLYWRALTPLEQDYPLFVHLLTPQNMPMGNITSHPGWGRNPTSLWQTGAIYPDRYRIRVGESVGAPSHMLSGIYVGFLEPASLSRLPIRTGDGQAVERARIGEVTVLAADSLESTRSYLQNGDIYFQDQIHLLGFGAPTSLGSGEQRTLHVPLLWEATGQPSQNYTAFLHLINQAGEQVGGFDQPPAEGRFPTSAWRAGDRILSQFAVEIPPDLPPGPYTLWVGLYADSGGLERLAVSSQQRPVQDQRVQIGVIDIP